MAARRVLKRVRDGAAGAGQVVVVVVMVDHLLAEQREHGCDRDAEAAWGQGASGVRTQEGMATDQTLCPFLSVLLVATDPVGGDLKLPTATVRGTLPSRRLSWSTWFHLSLPLRLTARERVCDPVRVAAHAADRRRGPRGAQQRPGGLGRSSLSACWQLT